jgi:hypothetical protein
MPGRSMPGQTSPPPSDVVPRSAWVTPVGAGAVNGAVSAELTACTHALLSRSKRVTGLFGLRQKSSAVGSANNIPTCLTDPSVFVPIMRLWTGWKTLLSLTRDELVVRRPLMRRLNCRPCVLTTLLKQPR